MAAIVHIPLTTGPVTVNGTWPTPVPLVPGYRRALLRAKTHTLAQAKKLSRTVGRGKQQNCCRNSKDEIHVSPCLHLMSSRFLHSYISAPELTRDKTSDTRPQGSGLGPRPPWSQKPCLPPFSMCQGRNAAEWRHNAPTRAFVFVTCNVLPQLRQSVSIWRGYSVMDACRTQTGCTNKRRGMHR